VTRGSGLMARQLGLPHRPVVEVMELQRGLCVTTGLRCALFMGD
jgi:hypothetical protein